MSTPVYSRFHRSLSSWGVSLLLSASVGANLWAAERDTAAKEQVFPLNEVPAWAPEVRGDFLTGQRETCSTQAVAAVKAHPSFKSARPLYGSARFDADVRRPHSGRLFHFALDESRGTGKGYDRFYFDLNQDLSLANDAPLNPITEPERASLTWSTLRDQIFFGRLKVGLEVATGEVRPVEILTRLIVWTNDEAAMTFVRPLIRKGEIRVGERRYTAELGPDFMVAGRLDGGITALHLFRQDNGGTEAYWWGADRLMAIHRMNDRFYQFTATPTGDRLTVSPFTGDLGTFTLGPGKRTLKKMEMKGSLEAAQLSVAVGSGAESESLQPATSCRLPVGDYLPLFLTLSYGDLRVELSQNYHSEGKPRDRGGRDPVRGIRIRKDQPYTLDFSHSPEVMFASPSPDTQLRPGETLEVKAVLVDPVLDVMIRGLDDTTRHRTKEYTDPEGKKVQRKVAYSLDPQVTILRANGEKLAEGVMPFG